MSRAAAKRPDMVLTMAKTFTRAAYLVALLSLAACASAAPPAASAPPAAAVPEPPAPGAVGGALGDGLDDEDRARAIAAQQEAVSSGARKSWRGTRGAYGFIVPGPEAGGCRDYAHKIFVNGRPREAKGQACRSGDDWRVAS